MRLRGIESRDLCCGIESCVSALAQDNPSILMQNMNTKIRLSPDFVGMEADQALADLRQRIEYYEHMYETVQARRVPWIQQSNPMHPIPSI